MFQTTNQLFFAADFCLFAGVSPIVVFPTPHFFSTFYSYGHLPVISTYNPIYRMYNPIYNQL